MSMSPIDAQTQLIALCAEARARADAAGEPVVASWVLPLAPADALGGLALSGLTASRLAASGPALGYRSGCQPAGQTDSSGRAIDAATGAGTFRFAWCRPKTGFALVGTGTAREFIASGPHRFQDLSEQVGTALKLAVTGGSDATPHNGASTVLGPYAVGGFAFFDELCGGEWPGFAPAQMVIPERLQVHRDGQTSLVVSVPVAADAEPLERAECLRQLAHSELANSETTGSSPAATIEAIRTGSAPSANRTADRVAPIDSADPADPAESLALRRFSRGDEVTAHRRWRDMVAHAIARVRDESELTKVVLARAVSLCAGTSLRPLSALAYLRTAYPDCFSFLVDPGLGSEFIGASPERLAQLECGTLRLGALAGSAPRGDHPAADRALAEALLASPKERNEHALVVRAIEQAARPFGTVELPQTPDVVKLTNVQHLYTPITIRSAEKVSLLALLGRLHPTPAVGGVPRDVALEIIRQDEGFERGWFAAPVGWINGAGDGEFAVALRSGLIQGASARLFTGAGIVADSDPEAEYFETQLKLQPMLTALAHA